jgi:hypothetical protein
MNNPTRNATFIATLVAIAISLNACNGGGGGAPPGPGAPGNNSPIILEVRMNPSSVGPNGVVSFEVVARDADNDPLSYTWTATGGLFQNGASTFANAPATVIWTAPPVPNQQFVITVRVTDGRGGIAEQSRAVVVATPVVTPVTPQTGSVVSGTLLVSATATGGRPPLTFQAFLDPQFNNPAIATGPVNPDGSFSFPLNTLTISNGIHSLALVVFDSSVPPVRGSASVELRVDNSAPSNKIYFIRPSPNVQVGAGALSIEVFAFDSETAIREVRFFVDDEPLACTDHNNTNADNNGADSWTCNWLVPSAVERPLFAGPHSLKAMAFDSAGNFVISTSLPIFVLNCGTLVQGNLAGSVTWTPSISPVFIAEDVSVSSGATLTILPGTQVKFLPGKNMSISGSLIANGASFTSSAGGLCAPDPSQPPPSPGNWGKIHFLPGSSGNLQNVSIQFGGGNTGQMLRVDTPNFILRDSIVASSASDGILVTGPFTAAQPSISSTTISNNGGYPISMDPSFSGLAAGNVFSGNRIQAINITPGSISGGVIWPNHSIPYAVQGVVRILNTAQLTIGDGAILKFNTGAGFTIDGALNAQNVVLTSLKDDAFGGDTNGDGAASIPNPGDWQQIFFANNSTGRLERVQILYGGGGSALSALEIFSSSPTITDSVIKFSGSSGIRLNGSPVNLRPVLTRNIIENSMGFPIVIPPYFSLPVGPDKNDFRASNRLRAIGILKGDILPQVSPVVWSPQDLPYAILETVTVGSGATFNVSPGTIVKFQSATSGLVVRGTLNANQAIFTSFKDDIGGDSNGDDPESPPAPGDWGAITFEKGGSGALTASEVRYGGGGTSPAAIIIDDSAPVIQNSVISFSGSSGVLVRGTFAGLTGATITSNQFTNNQSYPVVMPPFFRGLVPNNSYVGNRFQGIRITAFSPGTLTEPGDDAITAENSPVVWVPHDVPYVVDTLIRVIANDPLNQASLRLTTFDGTNNRDLIVKFANPSAGLSAIVAPLTGDPRKDKCYPSGDPANVDARCIANLTIRSESASNRVYLTSLKDDRYGGDTNGDLSSTTPTPGDWLGLQYLLNAGGGVTSANISYAGLPDTPSNPFANAQILIRDSSPDINDVVVEFSGASGIVLDRQSNPVRTNPAIRQSLFRNNAAFPLVLPASYLRTGFALENNNTYDSNPATRNRYNGIAIYPGTLSTAFVTSIWPLFTSADNGQPVPYVILGTITVPSTVELRFLEGSVIKFFDQILYDTNGDGAINLRDESPGIVVFGKLTSLGTQISPIIMTSFRDDSFPVGPLGDTNGDGAITIPAAGDWGSIIVRTQISGELNNVRVRYGGRVPVNPQNCVPSVRRGLLTFEGPSTAGQRFILRSAIVEFALQDGIRINPPSGSFAPVNVDIIQSFITSSGGDACGGRDVNLNAYGGDGIFINGGDVRIVQVSSVSNRQRGINAQNSTQLQIDAVLIENNRGHGILISGSRPTIVDTQHNPSFPHIIRNNGGTGLYLVDPLTFVIDDIQVLNNASDGIRIEITQPATLVTGEITDSESKGNLGDGLRLFNTSAAPISTQGIVFVPNVRRFITADNQGAGIRIFHSAPQITLSSIVNNHDFGIRVEVLRDTIYADLLSGGPDPGATPGALSNNSQISLAASSPAIGTANPVGPFPGDCPRTLPYNNPYNCFKDNSPYQIFMPPSLNLRPGNFFQPVASQNPDSINAILVHGGPIWNQNQENIDPDDPTTYVRLPPDTTWRRFENQVVYVVTDDIIILPESSDGFPDHPNDEDIQTRIVFSVASASSTAPVIVKFLDKPVNPTFSRAAVDVHIHSTFLSTNAIFTSVKDDSRGGDTDRKVALPLPGDWGGFIFYNESRDYFDSMTSADNDADPDPCAFHPNIDPDACDAVPATRDWQSEIVNTSFLYGGNSLNGMIEMRASSPDIHATSPDGTVVGFSAANGIYVDGGNLLNTVNVLGYLPAYNSLQDWALLGFWPIQWLQNNAFPRIFNTKFEGNTNFACLMVLGANTNNVDGIANFRGSNTYTANGHDACCEVGSTDPACAP